MNQSNRYELTLRSTKKDESSPCIVRDMKKCILCGCCMESCGKVKGIQVMAKENRGFHTEIVPPYGKDLVDTSCCPGGCIGGGENAPTTWKKLAARRDAIYREDRNLPIRKSHENPYVQKVYKEFLGEPLSEKSHEFLHTHYISRRDLIR